jgi:hexulose-6-phosphate isomerase
LLFVPGAIIIPWDRSYPPVPYEQAIDWARQATAELAKTAEDVGVELCVENVWNGLFYSPLEFRDFIDSIASPAVGIYFDAGNVLGYHQYPHHWIAILGARIRRVHVKDFQRQIGGLGGFCQLLEGDMPWKETIQALRAIGYDRTIVAEMIPPAEGLLQRTSKALDTILAMGNT